MMVPVVFFETNSQAGNNLFEAGMEEIDYHMLRVHLYIQSIQSEKIH